MPGLIRGVARTAAIAGTATAVSNRVSRRQARRWGQQDAYQEPAPTYAAPRPARRAAGAAPAPRTRSQQLKELAALRDQGILTDAEFAAQKAKVLGT